MHKEQYKIGLTVTRSLMNRPYSIFRSLSRLFYSKCRICIFYLRYLSHTKLILPLWIELFSIITTTSSFAGRNSGLFCTSTVASGSVTEWLHYNIHCLRWWLHFHPLTDSGSNPSKHGKVPEQVYGKETLIGRLGDSGLLYLGCIFTLYGQFI